MPSMIRIAITAEAFEAVAAILPGSVGFGRDLGDAGERLIWLEPHVLNKLRALRGPGESYSDVILRLVEIEARALIDQRASFNSSSTIRAHDCSTAGRTARTTTGKTAADDKPPMVGGGTSRGRAIVRPRFPAVRRTSMSHTLAEAAAAPSDFAESLIARLATGLDSVDGDPFRLAAESALAALPPAMLGDGAVYRMVEPVWRRYFHPRSCGAMAWDVGARKRGSKLIEEGKRRY